MVIKLAFIESLLSKLRECKLGLNDNIALSNVPSGAQAGLCPSQAGPSRGAQHIAQHLGNLKSDYNR